MTPPVVPTPHRRCAGPVLSYPGRGRGDDLVRSRSRCPGIGHSERIDVPFGRDSHGAAVRWSLSAGRNLLVHQRAERLSPDLPLTLMATTALAGCTHELFVADPCGRYDWLGGLDRPGRAHGARTPDAIARMLTTLASAAPGPRRLLLVADLTQTVAALDEAGGRLLTELATTARTRNLTVVASTPDRTARWFPRGLIAAFDDVVERGASTVVHRGRAVWTDVGRTQSNATG
ncbi:hypothetical protein [Rhodococcus chondri]|uniref:Uncharacterized protein n=1 Tax=Rhodococcus chondri TaxID=3065941 RepID=A0ABU7JX23_9NOCA|nr:hypothetical protein [Rhodococcus sp. CC-R104]MEE2034064.1 hypothetical protein [Rhodococcus sp. CC-R104]